MFLSPDFTSYVYTYILRSGCCCSLYVCFWACSFPLDLHEIRPIRTECYASSLPDSVKVLWFYCTLFSFIVSWQFVYRRKSCVNLVVLVELVCFIAIQLAVLSDYTILDYLFELFRLFSSAYSWRLEKSVPQRQYCISRLSAEGVLDILMQRRILCSCGPPYAFLANSYCYCFLNKRALIKFLFSFTLSSLLIISSSLRR